MFTSVFNGLATEVDPFEIVLDHFTALSILSLNIRDPYVKQGLRVGSTKNKSKGVISVGLNDQLQSPKRKITFPGNFACNKSKIDVLEKKRTSCQQPLAKCKIHRSVSSHEPCLESALGLLLSYLFCPYLNSFTQH